MAREYKKIVIVTGGSSGIFHSRPSTRQARPLFPLTLTLWKMKLNPMASMLLS